MTDYKLVPVEPTQEMVKAFCVATKAVTTEEWEDPLYADQVAGVLKNMPPAYRAMLAAAPDVQGEPVAWLIDWPEEPELGYYFSDDPSEHARSRPLCLAPQPAGQQPAPDVARLVAGVEFLINRLREMEDLLVDDELCRNYLGHVAPAIARLHGLVAAQRKGGE